MTYEVHCQLTYRQCIIITNCTANKCHKCLKSSSCFIKQRVIHLYYLSMSLLANKASMLFPYQTSTARSVTVPSFESCAGDLNQCPCFKLTNTIIINTIFKLLLYLDERRHCDWRNHGEARK